MKKYLIALLAAIICGSSVFACAKKDSPKLASDKSQEKISLQQQEIKEKNERQGMKSVGTQTDFEIKENDENQIKMRKLKVKVGRGLLDDSMATFELELPESTKLATLYLIIQSHMFDYYHKHNDNNTNLIRELAGGKAPATKYQIHLPREFSYGFLDFETTIDKIKQDELYLTN